MIFKFILFISLIVASSSRAASIQVGALSYPPQALDKVLPAKVRSLFQFSDQKWAPMTEKDSSGDWEVIQDAKVIGQIKKGDPESFKGPSISTDFDTHQGSVVRKSFALVKGPILADKEGWSTFEPAGPEGKALKSSFLKLIKRDSEKEKRHFRCPGYRYKGGGRKKKQEKCGDALAKVQILKALQNNSNVKILRFRIETDKSGEFDGMSEVVSKWILFDQKNQKGRLLFSDGEDLWDADLVEIADFDQNGTPELLFETSGYNRHGFELFDHELKSLASKKESFH